MSKNELNGGGVSKNELNGGGVSKMNYMGEE